MTRRTGLLVAAALAGLLAAAAYLAAPGRIVPEQPARLAIAVPASTAPALLHVAAARGFFAEENLDVSIVPATHGRAAAELLAQGKADLAAAAEVVFVLGVLAGADLAIAASISASNDSAIVARRDRGIAAPADLAGKRLGVTFGTSADYFLWAFLIRHKLPPESAVLVNLLPGEIAKALAGGTVDAVATWNPIILEARSALGASAAVFTEPGIYTQTFVLFGRGDVVRGQPAAMRRLARALLKAERFMGAHPDEALLIAAERLKLDADALRPGWRNFEFKVDLLQSQLMQMEDQARWAMARGHVPAGPVANFIPHLHLDALLAVQPERVTIVR